jgi:hypothetical protein
VDDVAELSKSHPGLQCEIDACVIFFESKDFEVNPAKSDVICFCRPRSSVQSFSCTFGGVARTNTDVVRYLGIHFDEKGNWKFQKQLALAKTRAALGRCKVVINTIGKGNIRQAVNLFDSLVASLYRFALGAWGPTAGKLQAFDDVFVKFILWNFHFPRTTCKTGILASFGRRCTECDSLFLAAVEIARASLTDNEVWKEVVNELKAGRLKSKWFTKVRVALEARGLKDQIWEQPAETVAERGTLGLRFSQYCFHHHLNLPRGTSADQIRSLQPFGVYPFLYRSSPFLSRFLLAFLLSNWRWIDGGKCRNHPRECDQCHVHNSAFHVLFECVLFNEIRSDFENVTGREFIFQTLTEDCDGLPRKVVEVGKRIFEKIVAFYLFESVVL